MMFTRRHFMATAAATPLLGSAAMASAPLKVTATTGMVADIARALSGELAEVTALMGPGIDPHSYRQTRSDIVALTRADLVLWNGHYLEAQLEDLLQNLAARQPVTAVAEAVPEAELLRHEDYAGRADPHVWMAPRLWRHAVHATRDALNAQRPDAAETLAARSESYLAEIDTIGTYAAEVLATVPEPARVLISAHDAFGYFGAEYGFEVMGIQGISTESEAGLSRISDLVNLLVARRIGAVFVESTLSARNVRALIEGAAAQDHDVRLGGELFSDAMGLPGTYEGTYIGMIDHNATTIARALGGSAPQGGRFGKLSAGI